MKEEETNDLIFAFVHGELTEEEARRVRARAAEDPAFAREIALARAAKRLLDARKPVAPQPFFWTRLSARLEEAEAPYQAWLWVAKRLIPAMVAATLLVTAVVWQQTRDRSPAETSDSSMVAYESLDALVMDATDISKDAVLQSVVYQNGAEEGTGATPDRSR